MGGIHAQVYGALPRARVAAIVDDDVARAQAKAKQLGFDVPVFQDIDEAGLYPLGPESTPTPTMWLPDDAQRRKHAAATSAVGTAEQVDAELRHLLDALGS